MTARRAASATIVVLLAASLSACVAPTSDATTTFVDAAEYRRLYRETVANFPEQMPDGVAFPDEPPVLDGAIGVGNASGAAYFHWLCAWEDVYLSATDGVQRTQAMAQLRMLPETAWGMRYWDDPDGVWEGLLTAAELGDPTELRQFYETDCAYYREQQEGAE